MNKTWLIIKREYLSRVRNKAFLLSTFLLPIVMILFIFGSVFFASRSSDSKKLIAVVNDPGYMKGNLSADSAKVVFQFNEAISDKNFIEKGYDGVLFMNTDSTIKKFKLVSKKTISPITKEYIEERLDKAFTNRQLLNRGITPVELDSITKNSTGFSSIQNNVAGENGEEKKVNAGLNYGIGFASGILIYITMFIFGAMVMRGVMEEKTNRIAEVMVSSVKPFQLMLGKILGIGAVGLTQLFLWIVLIFALMTGAQLFISQETLSQVQQLQQNPAMANNNAAMVSEAAKNIYEMQTSLIAIPWMKIIVCFIFYFLGGYLFYSALFAAIGSVVSDDAQEAQSLMLPITMPIIFGFIILSSNLNTPDNSAMFWGSMIPFTSPIVMMGRIASNPPMWQVALSMFFLIIGFLFTTWLAAKIYRTGILMYGKKPTWKEMLKWAFRKA